MNAPALLLIVGASGSGKTGTIRDLAARRLPGVSCHHFDSIGVPPVEVMEREFGSMERWQEAFTDRWIERLASHADDSDVCVLEGQTRPSFLVPALRKAAVSVYDIVVLDCAPEVRRARLNGPRAQPELATTRMDSWAAYLRGQADALQLLVVDTSTLSISETADRLLPVIEVLRARTVAQQGAAPDAEQLS